MTTFFYRSPVLCLSTLVLIIWYTKVETGAAYTT